MTRTPRLVLCLLLATALGAACSQRVTPEEEYSEEERERPLVDPSQLPPQMGQGQGGGAAAGAPMQAPAAAPAVEEPAEDAIRGTISLPEGVDPGGGTVFLFVRAPGAGGGPPLAVQRYPGSALPLEYAIGSESMMMGGGSLPGEVIVEARLDADGNAMTTGPDDFSARSEPVAPGAEGVDLPLSGS